MQKLSIFITIIFLGINFWSCSKDKDTPDNEVPIPVDYREKYAGSYKCSGQFHYYENPPVDSPNHSYTKDTIIIVNIKLSGDSDLSVQYKYFEQTGKLEEDGVCQFYYHSAGWAKFYGKDSVYLYLRYGGLGSGYIYDLSGRKIK